MFEDFKKKKTKKKKKKKKQIKTARESVPSKQAYEYAWVFMQE